MELGTKYVGGSTQGEMGDVTGSVTEEKTLTATAYLIVKHLMNDTIVTPDDAMKYLGIQPLAVIPEGDLGNFNKKRKKPSKKKGK